MEHYPDIQRQQGTLFFIPHGNRAAIAMSIERLIDLLDAAEGDPDIEANGDERDQSYPEGWTMANRPIEDDEDDADDEPNLGAFEQHPHVWSNLHAGDQTRWASGAVDDREDDGDDLEPSLLSTAYHNGIVEVDVEGDGSDDEYSHGWTSHIDQNVALMNCSGQWTGEGEPNLGWSGHGTGWREGEDPQSREADLLGDSECELDLAEHGICDHDEDTCSVLTAAQAGLAFDGSGIAAVLDMIRGLPIAARRADAYAMLGGRAAC